MSARVIGRTGLTAGQDFPITGVAAIGAAPDSEIRIVAPGVSRKHARIVVENDQYFLEDAGATNGTFLNGGRITREPLRHLDVITLGRDIDLIFLKREGEAPAAPAPDQITGARVQIIDGPDAGTPVDVPKGEVTFGRAPSCNVVLASGLISKVHARIQRTANQVVLQDLQSINGTFVNGARVDSVQVLKNGDVINFAGVRSVSVAIDGPGAMKTTAAAAISDEPAFNQEWKTRFVWAPDELAAIEAARAEAMQLAALRSAPPAEKKAAPPPLPRRTDAAKAEGAAAAPAKPAAAPPKPAVAPPKPPAPAVAPKPAAAAPVAPTPAAAAAKPSVEAPPIAPKPTPPVAPKSEGAREGVATPAAVEAARAANPPAPPAPVANVPVAPITPPTPPAAAAQAQAQVARPAGPAQGAVQDAEAAVKPGSPIPVTPDPAAASVPGTPQPATAAEAAAKAAAPAVAAKPAAPPPVTPKPPPPPVAPPVAAAKPAAPPPVAPVPADVDRTIAMVPDDDRTIVVPKTPRLTGVRLVGAGPPISVGVGTFVVGRAVGADVRLDDRQVSRSHARLTVDETSASIEDLQTVNGTLVNGKEVKARQPLRHGDTVQFGASEFKVELITT